MQQQVMVEAAVLMLAVLVQRLAVVAAVLLVVVQLEPLARLAQAVNYESYSRFLHLQSARMTKMQFDFVASAAQKAVLVEQAEQTLEQLSAALVHAPVVLAEQID